VEGPRLYGEFAAWWPLVSDPDEYAEEAAVYRKTILEHGTGPIRTLLELGSGGGNNASHMKADFELTLVDRAPGMLAVSRALNPEVSHYQGDMRSVRLDRTFDAVFIHDAVSYLRVEADLRSSLRTAFVHCRPGGVALFAPDFVRETFRPFTISGGHDRGRFGLRYVEWAWDPDPNDHTYTCDYAFLLRDDDGSMRAEHDRHILGLFPRSRWLEMIADAGFVSKLVPFGDSDDGARASEMFVGMKPADATS
jgi:SAM-dependent methyltransferase